MDNISVVAFPRRFQTIDKTIGAEGRGYLEEIGMLYSSLLDREVVELFNRIVPRINGIIEWRGIRPVEPLPPYSRLPPRNLRKG
jgi:hypothetical protein